MLPILRHPPQIENLRNHPAETVERLQELLRSGAPQREDQQRPNFFEIDDDQRVFYAYISPASGQVILLATWAREPQPEELAGQLA
jgi:hypothetical protein